MENIKIYNCPFCGQGKMKTKNIDYVITDASGKKSIIPNIDVDICDICEEKFFGYQAALKLEEIKKKNNRITLSLKPELQSLIKKSADKHERSFDDEINYLLERTLS